MANQESTPRRTPRNDISAEYVRSILNYNPDTGIFHWRVRFFENQRTSKIWNAKHAGNIAGSITAFGYIHIGVDDHPRYAHRLAWLWMIGEWVDEVDHKDRVRTNNRWSNLRQATCSKNQHNRGKSRNNTSGYKGVIRIKRSGKWIARICANGKSVSSRQFDSPEAAHEEYCKMAQQYHGEFARVA